MELEQIHESTSVQSSIPDMNLKSEDIDSQAPLSQVPDKLYDPTKVKIWPSSPVILGTSSIQDEDQQAQDPACPSAETLPDCFEDTRVTQDELMQMFTWLDNDPNDDLFVPQDDLMLPDIPQSRLSIEPGEDLMDISGDGKGTPADTSLEQNPGQSPDGEWPEEEEVTENFDEVAKWFQGLERPSLAELVQYEAAKLRENARKKQFGNREIIKEHPLSDDEEIVDINNNEQNVPVAESNMTQPSSNATQKRTMARKKRSPAELSEAEKKKTIQVGLDIALSKAKKIHAGKKGQKRAAANSNSSAPKKKAKKGPNKPEETLESLLNTNFVNDANISSAVEANAQLPTGIGNKDKALAELVAALPSVDQKEAKSDKRKCIVASRKFSRSAKVDGDNGWKLQGMRTTLYHYQLLGAAFMRERETCSRPPQGGFLCDTMGFGKTIQALANVVDGRHTIEDDHANSTLIVVPSHLVEHWKDQIVKHCEEVAIGDVTTYRANSRLDIINSPKSLQKFDVVITTYDQVRRSYPQPKGMPEIGDAAKITEWWTDLFEKQAGPLHRIRFLRIILDEGHLIKNHLSQTSIAVRALTGRYKWVLSGTPVQNYIHEFYPLFDFLEVPDTGTFSDFTARYCETQVARERLLNMLRSFMFRRTHSSRLFSVPVVKFPEIKEVTVQAEFCAAERAIYDAIITAFFNNINGLSKLENPTLAQHQCILTMMQKLRMICSHTLTVQGMVKKLLAGQLVKTLAKTVQNCTDPDDPSIPITTWLRAMAKNPFPRNSKPDEPVDEPTTESQEPQEPQQINPELVQEFHKLMSQLHEEEQWDERLARTNCPSCRFAPVSPVITSCLHLYCEECYYILGDKDNNSASPQRKCVECSQVIRAITPGAPVEEIDLEKAPSARPPEKSKQRPTKKQGKLKGNQSFNGSIRLGARQNDNADLDDEDREPDWIPACAAHMPSAKLTKIRELIAKWIAENPMVKIVVFTQFLDFVRILGIMCETQGWKHAKLTGKMSCRDRYKSIQDFRDQDDMRVFVVSLKAGGTGLDMPMASKCILVDLWWNEAVQDQAFARIYRIGQKNKVEFVKIIVKDTIDDNLLDLQQWKTTDISKTMGNQVLEGRATIIALLQMFADVQVSETGVITVSRPKAGAGRPSFRLGLRSG